MPFLFERISDYTELLMPDDLSSLKHQFLQKLEMLSQKIIVKM